MNDVLQRFEQFAQALQEGQLSEFQALCVVDAPSQDGLFELNSAWVRKERLALRPLGVKQEGAIAEVTFALVNPDGSERDRATATFSLELDGWRLRAL